jgi:hypothetical protein
VGACDAGSPPKRHLKRDDGWISELIDQGVPVRGIINDIMGGTAQKPNRGCVLRLRVGGQNPDLPVPRDVSQRWEESGWTDESKARRATPRATPSRQRGAESVGAGLGQLLAKLLKDLFR